MPDAVSADIIQSPLLLELPGLVHGFGTRATPGPLEHLPSWSEPRRPEWKQVHGTSNALVISDQQRCGEVDALWTREPGRTLAIVTADCVPILLARKDGQAQAAVHAGWRGTLARILEHLGTTLRQHGESPSDWSAAIGPCAQPCCYEVSEDLSRQFAEAFGSSCAPAPRRIDLVAANCAQLANMGVTSVDTSPALCTICSKTPSGAQRFSSYRRDGSGGRQLSMISTLP